MIRSTHMTVILSIAGEEHEHRAYVTYDFTPGRPARYSPWPGDPPEAAEAEIHAVLINGTDISGWLSEDQLLALEAKLTEEAEEVIADDGDKADREYDAHRDRQMEERA